MDNFLTGAFSLHVFYYYEVELGVPAFPFMLVAYVVYGLWNMFNDPIAGYLSDKPYKFVRKWGRRFPLFLSMAFPYSVVYLLIFSPPGASPSIDAWVGFGWLLFTTCLFDWVYSFWQTNWLAAFPVKFQGQKERARAGASTTYFGVLGIAAGMLVPSELIEFGDLGSYIRSAAVVAVVGLAVAAAMIPGMREGDEIKELAAKCVETEDPVKFFEALKAAFTSKNFLSYAFVYLAQLVLMTLGLGSLDYFARYVLGEEASAVTIIGAGLLVGGLVSTPVWERYARNRGNRKAYLWGSLFPAIALVPLMFVDDLASSVFFVVLLGLAIGGAWTLMFPAYSDVIDELIIKTGKRNEGVYTGIRTVFGRLPFVLQALVFSAIHHVTGFDQDPYSPLAQFGIRVHMALVPIVFYLVGFVMMLLVHDLTPERVAANKAKLREMGKI